MLSTSKTVLSRQFLKRLFQLEALSSTHVTLQVLLADMQLIDSTGTMRLQEGTWTIYVGGGGPSSASYGGSAVLQSTLILN